MSHLSLLIVAIPLAMAILVSVLPSRRLAWLFTLLSCLCTLGMALLLLDAVVRQGVVVYELGGWAPPWGIEYRVDGLNALVVLLITIAGAAVSLYGKSSVANEIAPPRQGRFYACFLLCLAGLCGIALTGDLFNLFVFLEIASLTSYALIAMGNNKKCLTAAFQYLLMGTLGATFLLIGIGLLFNATGTLNMQELATAIRLGAYPNSLMSAFVFILVGMLLKSALYPLHLWLPNAYTFAPSFVSVFLPATATKVCVYVIIRIYYDWFGADYVLSASSAWLLQLLAMFAILYAAALAIKQDCLKRLLAWSSLSQIGYMILGISLLSGTGMGAALVHLFNHGVMKATLFMSAGAFSLLLGTTRLASLRGQGRAQPLIFAVLIIGGLSLIGVPGTLGFVSKWLLLGAAVEQQAWMVVAVILSGSLLAVMYVWKLVEILYFPGEDAPRLATRPLPYSMAAAMVVMAALCLYFGVNSQVPRFAADMARELLLGVVI